MPTQTYQRGGLSPTLRNTLDQGAVLMAQNTVAYTDTVAKTLFTLPAGARVIDIKVDVETAFNSSGTDLLDVGKSGTNNHFLDDLDVAATGRKAPTLTNLGRNATPIVVTAIYAQSVADATAGSATVTFLYTAS